MDTQIIFFWTNCAFWSTLFLDILAFGRRQLGCRLFSFRRKSAKHRGARLFARTRQPIPGIMLTPKPFRIRTYKPSRKCSFQRTYRSVKSFRIRTYKKPRGVGAAPQAPYPRLYSAGFLGSTILFGRLAGIQAPLRP